jgi:DNA-binding LacI/PurR family transcriptional regulator
VTSIADPFNGEVVAGIEELGNQHGYSVILATSQADPDREVTVVRSFQERRVDGILVASSRVGALYAPLLSDLQIPIVLLNNQHRGEFVHSVSIDNAQGGYDATRHLIELGHERIAYLGDRFGLQSDAERLAGFKKAMREARARIRPEFVVRGDGKPEGARLAARELLSLEERPTAVFCYNDMSALGVLQETEQRNLAVPEDLSVAGFDDIFFAPLVRPPLTTVRQPKKEIGRRAMEILLGLLHGAEVDKTVTIRGDLVIRGSTARPRA